MRKIVGIGESILDISIKEGKTIHCDAGGSVYNTLSALGNRGYNPIYITEIGEDRVGEMLLERMKKNHIDTRYIYRFKGGNSPVALAFLGERGEASYQFFVQYPMKRLEVDFPSFEKDDILILSSYYSVRPELREKVESLIMKASEAGAIIYYDPNFRKGHIDMLPQVLPFIEKNMSFADIVRGSNEDFINIYNTKNTSLLYAERIRSLSSNFIYTKGGEEVELFTPTMKEHFSVPPIVPVSTIGAGDNFNAGVVYALLQKGITKTQLHELPPTLWREVVQKGIEFASLKLEINNSQ